MAGEASQERGLSSPTCDVQRWAEREVEAGQARDSGSAVHAWVRVVFRAPQGASGRRELYFRFPELQRRALLWKHGIDKPWGTSLGVQPAPHCRAHRSEPWSGKTPHCHRATKPDAEQGPERS